LSPRRNSWGTGWGNSGYFKLGREKQNMCQISSKAYYINVSTSQEEEE